MVYNLSAIASNSTSMLGMIQAVNDTLMFGMLGVVLLVGLFLVMLTSFIFTTGDFAKSFSAATFITLLITLLFTAMSLVDEFVLIIVILAAAASVAITSRVNR